MKNKRTTIQKPKRKNILWFFVFVPLYIALIVGVVKYLYRWFSDFQPTDKASSMPHEQRKVHAEKVINCIYYCLQHSKTVDFHCVYPGYNKR